VAQEMMEKTLRAIEDIECYIDDIGIFSDSWASHMEVLDKVCTRLEEKGFSVNPLKCEFGVKETDFLGHWLTPLGVKPLRKKIQGILDMEPPKDINQLRSFLGMVTYYRDMWPRRSHILAPLTELVGTKTFVWGDPQQQAFLQMKAIIARDTLLAYPDHNKKFFVETDASDYQLGGRIFQKDIGEDGKEVERNVAFYTRKLNSAQKNYTTIEKELLSIVEIFKEFRATLLGAEIDVFTDHKNLTYKLSQYSTQRVLRWRLTLEEFGAKFHYKTGASNYIADALSRVPTKRLERESTGKSGCVALLQDSELAECLFHDVELSECFLEHPVFDDEGRVPFQFSTLAEYQAKSAELMALPDVFPDRFARRVFHNSELVCFHQNGVDKIVLTSELLPKVVKYYHEAMAHAEGIGRLSHTIKRHFYHRDIDGAIKNIDDAVKKHIDDCETCKVNKRGGRVYGEAPPRDVRLAPWQEVHCDSIGNWTIELRARTLKFHAMTMIDPCTNLLEIRYTLGTTAREAADAVENTWLARYPRPVTIVTDQGPEFGLEFTEMCQRNGIIHRTSTSRNPQGNSLIERIHQTIAQVIRTVEASRNPKTVEEGKRCIEEVLGTAMHATRCACSESLGWNTPGSIAFGRDMFLDIPVIADIVAINNNRQLLVDKRLLRENSKRIRHDYAVGDLVYKKNYIGLSDKLSKTLSGPYPITQCHTNGNVTIRLKPNLTERINIRRVRPKFPLRK
jgi:transposase InsO family protein